MENLGLVWRQIDVDWRGRNRHFEHEGGITVSGRVIRILSGVVLTQQLTSGHTTQQGDRVHVNMNFFLKNVIRYKTSISCIIFAILNYSKWLYLHYLFMVDGSVVDENECLVRVWWTCGGMICSRFWKKALQNNLKKKHMKSNINELKITLQKK